MEYKPTYQELQDRILAVKTFNGGTLPVDHALVWQGYIAALLEWSLITVQDHSKLAELIPKTHLAPALSVFLGPEGAQEYMDQEGIDDSVVHASTVHASTD